MIDVCPRLSLLFTACLSAMDLRLYESALTSGTDYLSAPAFCGTTSLVQIFSLESIKGTRKDPERESGQRSRTEGEYKGLPLKSHGVQARGVLDPFRLRQGIVLPGC